MRQQKTPFEVTTETGPGVLEFRRRLNMDPKEGDTVDIEDSQSNTVFAGYPQTVELKNSMIYGSAT